MSNVKCLITFEFPNGQEGYVIWECSLFARMWRENSVEMIKTFFDSRQNGFDVQPDYVHIDLWENLELKDTPPFKGTIDRFLGFSSQLVPTGNYLWRIISL